MSPSKQRKKDFAYAIGSLVGEGMPINESTIAKALALNPESIVEKAMKAKRGNPDAYDQNLRDSELLKLAEETTELRESFKKGFEESIPIPRRTLNNVEQQRLDRYKKLLSSNDPASIKTAEMELECYIAQLLGDGVHPDSIKRRLRQ